MHIFIIHPLACAFSELDDPCDPGDRICDVSREIFSTHFRCTLELSTQKLAGKLDSLVHV